MRYPLPILPGATIGVTAPSSGVDSAMHRRLDLAITNLRDRGYQVLEGQCLRDRNNPASDSAKNRAHDFMELYCHEEVAAIFPPWGGELAIDVLPLLDWDRLRAVPPKWIIGYSDTSTLLLPFTIRLEMGTLHAINLMNCIEAQKDPLSQQLYEVLKTKPGDMVKSVPSMAYQEQFLPFEQFPEAPYVLDHPTAWKVLYGPDSFRFSGRLIGGCLDVVMFLTGTPYGDVARFNQRYSADGIIFYLENCELSPYDVHRALMNLKLAGWFQNINGILIGRNNGPSPASPYSYLEALKETLGDLEVPILYDIDIGHKPPNLNLINGSMTIVVWEGDKREVIQQLI